MLKQLCRITKLFGLLMLISTASIAAQQVVYMGNHKSGIYHNSSCRYYDCKNCTVVLKSREEARRLGFRACKICGG